MNGILNQSTVVKKMILINQIFMKEIVYLMKFFKIVEFNIFIHSNIDLFVILNSQIFLIMKKSISQLLIEQGILKLNSTV